VAAWRFLGIFYPLKSIRWLRKTVAYRLILLTLFSSTLLIPTMYWGITIKKVEPVDRSLEAKNGDVLYGFYLTPLQFKILFYVYA